MHRLLFGFLVSFSTASTGCLPSVCGDDDVPPGVTSFVGLHTTVDVETREPVVLLFAQEADVCGGFTWGSLRWDGERILVKEGVVPEVDWTYGEVVASAGTSRWRSHNLAMRHEWSTAGLEMRFEHTGGSTTIRCTSGPAPLACAEAESEGG